MNDISDYELLMLYHEKNIDAEKIIYKRYLKIIKKMLKKYQEVLSKINICEEDLYCGCLDALTLAINSYSSLYDSSFYTYAYLLIDRFIKKELIKYNRPKNRGVNNTYSLEFHYQDLALEDTIIDERGIDPLCLLETYDDIRIISKLAKKILSNFEYKIYCFLLKGLSNKEIVKILNKSEKQIENALYRIRKKLKEEILLNFA